MDRQRNDRLGRRDDGNLEHRRQILRRCTESDTHANTFSDAPTATSTATRRRRTCICNGNTYVYTNGDSELDAQRLNLHRDRARRRYLDR